MAIWNYTGGHCSYCGKPITLEEMQIDHVKPLCRNVRHIPGIENHPHYKDRIGNNSQDNLRASCPKCNRWKAQMTLEEFRKVFEKQYKNLSRTNSAFKLLYDYGLISVTNNFKVKFFFEKII